MNNYIIDGITNIDRELIEKYCRYKQTCKINRKRKNKWLLSAVAACLILSICIPTVIIYTPVEYDLEYYSADGPDIGLKTSNVWIYYTNGTEINRERVRLPCSNYGLFVAWKHLNNIGNDVAYLGSNFKRIEAIDESDLDREYDFHFHNDKKVKNQYAIWIRISKNIESYFSQYDKRTLMISLIRTLNEPDTIFYCDVYIIFE